MGRASVLAIASLILGSGLAALVLPAVDPGRSEGSAAVALGKPGPEIVRVAGKIGSLCTGVGITSDRVLTAKHCVDGPQSGVLIGAQSLAVHPGCVLAEHADRDLALIAIGGTLSNTFPLSAGVAPLPTDKKEVQISGFSDWYGWSGTSLVSGVGTTTFGVDSTSGDTASLPCSGDSGGPAYFDGELVGIASKLKATFDCANDIAEYTYVGDLSAWVMPYTNDNSCEKEITGQRDKLVTEQGGLHKDLLRMIRPPDQ